MSVIHEALKKSGQPVEFRPPFFLKKKRSINWGPLFVMSVLILIVSPILAPIFRNPYRNEALPSRLPEPAIKESHMKAQFAVEETPITPAAAPVAAVTPVLPNLCLNGLVYSGNDSYCLINGKVVKIGETVSGATLTRVTADEAELDYHGQKIILPANI